MTDMCLSRTAMDRGPESRHARTLFLPREDGLIRRKTLLVFLALFLGGVFGIVAGRAIGWGADAQEEVAGAPHVGSRLGAALGQAIGLIPGKPAAPLRRD
jgi:hypothetical protein